VDKDGKLQSMKFEEWKRKKAEITKVSEKAFREATDAAAKQGLDAAAKKRIVASW
jgi:uncharacterized membrane protein